MRLSPVERRILINQFRILEKLEPKDRSHSQNAKALEEGYTREYRDILGAESEEMSEEACAEVLEIMELYRQMNRCFEQLGHPASIDQRDLEFGGFDGNNETEQLQYALYYIEDLGRFDELRGKYLNSHGPRLDQYRRMLRAWGTGPDRYNLSEDDIRRILAARLTPA